MIKTYQHLPNKVTAVQWNGHNLDEIKWFMKDKFIEAIISEEYYTITIQTPDGGIGVSLGDYICLNQDGCFYCTNRIVFEYNYEESNDQTIS